MNEQTEKDQVEFLIKALRNEIRKIQIMRGFKDTMTLKLLEILEIEHGLLDDIYTNSDGFDYNQLKKWNETQALAKQLVKQVVNK